MTLSRILDRTSYTKQPTADILHQSTCLRSHEIANSIRIVQQITKPMKETETILKSKVKWVDDVTLCCAVDLKTTLVPEDRAVPRPLP